MPNDGVELISLAFLEYYGQALNKCITPFIPFVPQQRPKVQFGRDFAFIVERPLHKVKPNQNNRRKMCKSSLINIFPCAVPLQHDKIF